ncbi:MAG: DEAD/DEAH box helicase [Chitinivibrionales bacterium]|nr:DEAD/DEAH box helicase [Chitinivibrionales bacterium]
MVLWKGIIMEFSHFGFAETVMEGVRRAGYTSPTEIQHKAIPVALQGLDIIGCAPTGTGKTAAFVLPILHRLCEPSAAVHGARLPRALILAPTRELTQQITESVTRYGARSALRSCSIYGGVPIRDQIRKLRKGSDIVAATPGRLLDHLKRRTIDLSCVEILVLDEADRMYDMGFIKDVRKIIKEVPKKRQTLLFSATVSPEIKRLIREIQRDPKVIEIGAPGTPVHTVEQQFYTISQQKKMDLLTHILKNEMIETMLVFSRTKHGADKISRWLGRSGIQSVALHAGRTQSQRRQALNGFKYGRYKVLVATDIAARGIDVTGISHVLNYDAPEYGENYVHRIGRTGRAETTGTAITFVAYGEQKQMRSIERSIGKRVNALRYPGFDYPEALVPETPEPTRRPFGRQSGGGRKMRFTKAQRSFR